MARAKAEKVNKHEGGDAAVSKMSMVEAALDALGEDASPADIAPFVQDRFGTDIGRQMISSYASQIRKKRRGGASGTVRVGGNGSGLGAKDLAVLQDLIRKVGPAELQSYIKVLGG